MIFINLLWLLILIYWVVLVWFKNFCRVFFCINCCICFISCIIIIFVIFLVMMVIKFWVVCFLILFKFINLVLFSCMVRGIMCS